MVIEHKSIFILQELIFFLLASDIEPCRLCLGEEDVKHNIFEETIDTGVPIFVAIISCIQPLEVNK